MNPRGDDVGVGDGGGVRMCGGVACVRRRRGGGRQVDKEALVVLLVLGLVIVLVMACSLTHLLDGPRDGGAVPRSP